MTNKRKTVTARGSVLLISSLLIASAGIRVLTSAEAALAEIGASDKLVLPLAANSPASSKIDQDRAEMSSLLTALRDRESIVAKREKDLDMRNKALDVAQFEIQRRLDALEAAERRLEATLTVAQTASEDDLARLTSVYENMKPKDAAALFEEMEPEFAAGFIARMRPDSAAKVMSGLNPQAAYSISVMLAGRNANAPKS